MRTFKKKWTRGSDSEDHNTPLVTSAAGQAMKVRGRGAITPRQRRKTDRETPAEGLASGSL